MYRVRRRNNIIAFVDVFRNRLCRLSSECIQKIRDTPHARIVFESQQLIGNRGIRVYFISRWNVIIIIIIMRSLRVLVSRTQLHVYASVA